VARRSAITVLRVLTSPVELPALSGSMTSSSRSQSPLDAGTFAD
jgi:hypothetical protein